jgi:uncharacterized protein YcbK (DUF882 family)
VLNDIFSAGGHAKIISCIKNKFLSGVRFFEQRYCCMESKIKSPDPISRHGMSRRDFLAAGAAVTAACFFPYEAVAGVFMDFSVERSLRFFNTHTDEKITAVYWSQGTFVPQALVDINHILRDHRTGEKKEIDTYLLDLLFALQQKLESAGPFHIISGYRSPETNSLLRMMSKGIAKNSLHTEGKAIDIRLPGYDLMTVQRAARDLQMGGVGYYPLSDFVHVDVGSVRYW